MNILDKDVPHPRQDKVGQHEISPPVPCKAEELLISGIFQLVVSDVSWSLFAETTDIESRSERDDDVCLFNLIPSCSTCEPFVLLGSDRDSVNKLHGAQRDVFRVLCQRPWPVALSSSEACMSTTIVGSSHHLRWFLEAQPSHLLFQGRKEGPVPSENLHTLFIASCGLHLVHLHGHHQWLQVKLENRFQFGVLAAFHSLSHQPPHLYYRFWQFTNIFFFYLCPLSSCCRHVLWVFSILLKGHILYIFLFPCILLICFWSLISELWIM